MADGETGSSRDVPPRKGFGDGHEGPQSVVDGCGGLWADEGCFPTSLQEKEAAVVDLKEDVARVNTILESVRNDHEERMQQMSTELQAKARELEVNPCRSVP